MTCRMCKEKPIKDQEGLDTLCMKHKTEYMDFYMYVRLTDRLDW